MGWARLVPTLPPLVGQLTEYKSNTSSITLIQGPQINTYKSL